jgi:hypothetical protein
MGFREDVMKLRTRLQDLVRLEVIDHKNFRELYQATFLEVMNETERKRLDIEKAMELLKHQLSREEGRLLAIDQMRALIFAIVDGYCRGQERAIEEEKRLADEKREKEEYAAKQASETSQESQEASDEPEAEAGGEQPSDDGKGRRKARKG